MQGNLTIVGVKRFKGTIETTSFDQTKLMVLLPFPRARADTNKGFDVQEVAYGLSDNFNIFNGRTFPVIADCEYEVTTKGLEIFECKISNVPPNTAGKS